MIYYAFPNNRLWKAAFALFLSAMLFLARDSMYTTAVLGFYKAQFLMLALIVLAGVVFLWVNRRNLGRILTDGRLILAAVLALVVLAPMVLKRDWQLMYFSILLCIFFAVFVSYFLSVQEAAKYYVVILAVLGTYSMIATYILRIGVDAGVYSVPVFQNSIGYTFYNFFGAIVSESYVKTRNFGIFREPGVYQYFLLLALYLNNYTVRWSKNRQMWICNGLLTAAMISTFSTAGVLELGLLALVVFFDKKLYRDKRVWLALGVCAAAAALVAARSIARMDSLYWEVYTMVIGKFVNGEDSFLERIQAFAVNICLFLDSPIVGQTISDTLHAVENNTSSTLILFSVFGLAGGCFHVAAWAALVWEGRKTWLRGLLLMGILMMSFNTQNLIADVFFWLFPVMALTQRWVPTVEKWKARGKGNGQ